MHGCEQVAPRSSSLPSEAPDDLLGGGESTTEKISGGDANLGFELEQCRGLGGKGFWGSTKGQWRPLNRVEVAPCRAGHAWEGVHVAETRA